MANSHNSVIPFFQEMPRHYGLVDLEQGEESSDESYDHTSKNHLTRYSLSSHAKPIEEVNTSWMKRHCKCQISISQALFGIFIAQAIIGLLLSFILLYTSGNRVLSEVTDSQRLQTQDVINYQITKLNNITELIFAHIRFQLYHGQINVASITTWVHFFEFMKSNYQNRAPVTMFQLGNIKNQYLGAVENILEFANNGIRYHYKNVNDRNVDPFTKENLLDYGPFPFKPIERPWFKPFYNKTRYVTSPIWTEFTALWNSTSSINVASPIYVQNPNITASEIYANESVHCRNPNHLYAVVGILYSLNDLRNFLATTQKTYYFINNIWILNKNTGSILAASNGNTSSSSMSPNLYRSVIAYSKPMGKNQFTMEGKNIEVNAIKGRYNMTWIVVLEYHGIDLLTQMFTNSITSIVIFIVIMVIGTLVLFVLVQALIQPLTKIRKKMDKLVRLKSLEVKDTIGGCELFSDLREMRNSIYSLRRAIRAFSKYVPHIIVKKAISENLTNYTTIGMELQTLTVYNSDIVDFTAFAEKTETSIFLQMMTDYFSRMCKIIEYHQGLIDKFIGDSIMAFWNEKSFPVEEHEIRACKAALETFEILDELNTSWDEQNFPTFQMRVGISSGKMLCGNIGTPSRMSFTVVGDNTAPCLENLNRKYDTKVLISESTYEHVKDEFVCYFVDYLKLKKCSNRSMRVYSLESTNKAASDLQVKIANDLEAAQKYMFQHNFCSMIQVCESAAEFSKSRVVTNLLLRAKELHKMNVSGRRYSIVTEE